MLHIHTIITLDEFANISKIVYNVFIKGQIKEKITQKIMQNTSKGRTVVTKHLTSTSEVQPKPQLKSAFNTDSELVKAIQEIEHRTKLRIEKIALEAYKKIEQAIQKIKEEAYVEIQSTKQQSETEIDKMVRERTHKIKEMDSYFLTKHTYHPEIQRDRINALHARIKSQNIKSQDIIRKDISTITSNEDLTHESKKILPPLKLALQQSDIKKIKSKYQKKYNFKLISPKHTELDDTAKTMKQKTNNHTFTTFIISETTEKSSVKSL